MGTELYPALKEKGLTRRDIIEGNINMLESGARECRKIGKLASAEEKEIIAEILRNELNHIPVGRPIPNIEKGNRVIGTIDGGFPEDDEESVIPARFLREDTECTPK